jgi:hypothetical protein
MEADCFKFKNPDEWTTSDVMVLLGAVSYRVCHINNNRNNRPKLEYNKLLNKLNAISDGFGTMTCGEMVPIVESWRYHLKMLQRSPEAARYFCKTFDWLREHADVEIDKMSAAEFMIGFCSKAFADDNEVI